MDQLIPDTAELIAICTGILCCSIIAWTDFTRRSIWLIPMLTLFIAGFAFRHQHGLITLIIDFAWNLLFVAIILGGVLLIYRFMGVKKVMDRKLGWGDIIMLGAISSWLDPAGFLLFYEASMLITLVLFLLLKLFLRLPEKYPIPLAGTLALILIAFVPFYFFHGYEFLKLILH
ncbi:MAG: hypothetical protein H6581_28400 [Bacteroidia bacterium]|nr:hypothetical protein [Bacteroidia bacterium]